MQRVYRAVWRIMERLQNTDCVRGDGAVEASERWAMERAVLAGLVCGPETVDWAVC